MEMDIVDNQTLRLADAVRDLMDSGAVAARFAVGYLFLEGLAPLQGPLGRMDDVQILIGNVVNRLTDEQVREEFHTLPQGGGGVRDQEDLAVSLRATHARAAAVTALNLRRTLQDMARTEDNRALLLTLARRVADGGLKVRLFTEGRIHAKIALLDYPPRAGRKASQVAVVGSSNLTLSGPAHPTEMNIVVRDPGSTKALDLWFQGLWQQSQDFHRELFDELGQCWAMDAVRLPAESISVP